MIGIDIVQVSRITKAVERYGDRFLDKVFTVEELAYTKQKRRMGETLAGRFAAKEAFIKAIGKSIPWKEIHIQQEEGKPYILFNGQRYDNVSIAHEREYAVAIVQINQLL